jgi:glycosyltransferase involved in cell wall biosynthesis
MVSVVRLFRVPYVLHLHGSEFREFYNESTAREQCAIRQTFDRAAAVIVLSKSWQRWVTGISTNPRIEVVPNAVPVPDQASVRPAHHLLFMGRLGERKGINTLLDAVAVLTREFPDLRVVCAGDGDLAAVRERIQVLGLQSCVTVPGWMGPAERTHLLQDASIFVLPSHNEGLPMAILEAMAAGLAVISTPVGGIPDAVIDNETGALVKPGDVNALAAALRRVLTDHALTERWGDAGRARVQQCFSPAASEARIRAVWEQVAP